MTGISRILLFVVGCVFTNNYVFGRMLGAGALLDDRGIEASAQLGLVLTAVMTVSSVVNWLIGSLLLTNLKADFLQIPVFVLVIALAVQAAETLCGDKLLGGAKASTQLTAACALLGASVLNVQGGYGFVEALLNGLFGGIGVLLALVLMAGVHERIRYSHIPEALKGYPIAMISAGLVALAFMGFMGMA